MQMKKLLMSVLLWSLLTVPAQAASTFLVSLDTSTLVGHAAGPFALNFQFNDGSGSGDANNTATLSDFLFYGGTSIGTATTLGGASGDLVSTATITDSAFLNVFTQSFISANLLTFRLSLTTNADAGPAPDQFSMAIFDSTGFEIPTMGLYTVGSDAMLIIDIDAGGLAIRTFGGDLSRVPFGGGHPIAIAAPQIVPEPWTFVLLAVGMTALVGGRALKNRVS
jgi:hypothetical protein